MADDEHSCTDDRYFDRRGPRYDIKNERVLELLKKGVSICEISRRLGCSQILIAQVRDGKRKEQKMPRKYNGKQMCRSCQIRPVKKGNRFLCAECFQGGSLGDLYYDATCYVSF